MLRWDGRFNFNKVGTRTSFNRGSEAALENSEERILRPKNRLRRRRKTFLDFLTKEKTKVFLEEHRQKQGLPEKLGKTISRRRLAKATASSSCSYVKPSRNIEARISEADKRIEKPIKERARHAIADSSAPSRVGHK